jgi:hypothetical protein
MNTDHDEKGATATQTEGGKETAAGLKFDDILPASADEFLTPDAAVEETDLLGLLSLSDASILNTLRLRFQRALLHAAVPIAPIACIIYNLDLFPFCVLLVSAQTLTHLLRVLDHTSRGKIRQILSEHEQLRQSKHSHGGREFHVAV